MSVVSSVLLLHAAVAEEPVRLRHQFEASETSWVTEDASRQLLYQHSRTATDSVSGEQCEQLGFRSANVITDARILHDVPPARVFDELKLTIWVRSNCPNLRVGVEILFPHQVDPRTGKYLVLSMFGEHYTASSEWQQLTCHLSDKDMERRLNRAQAELSNGVEAFEIDTRDMIVQRAILTFDIPDKESGILIDDLELGPIVAPRDSVADVMPVANSEPVIPPVKLQVGDRITKDGRPFFPLFSIYHGEEVEQLATLGINMVWVPDYHDQKLLAQLHEYHLGGIAVPAHPPRDELLTGISSIPGFSDTTTPIWAWMLGARIPPEDIEFVEAWAEQIHQADRRFRRPLMGEVLSNQRAFHRTTDLLASTRLPVQTSISPQEALQLAQRNRALALPGKATFAFVNTEPASETIDSRPSNAPFPVLEPEQILMQTTAAIGAGYRGIGFWKQYPLSEEIAGLNEREHAIRLACIEIRMLEEFLANSRVVRKLAVQVGDSDDQTPEFQSSLGGNNPFSSRWDSVLLPNGEVVNPANQASGLSAFLLQSDAGFLVLPLWLEEDAQFVPGPQVLKDVRFLMPPGTNAAWEVTTTGINSQIKLTPVAGGMEVHLEEMSQFSVIVATHSRDALDEIRDRARKYRAEAARSWIEMTASKTERTRRVDAELARLGAPEVNYSERRLTSAEALLARARKEFDKGNYDAVRVDCERALQYVRLLQRQHWENAVKDSTSPVASPYTICFSTLPAHWRLLADIGRRSSVSTNLLSSGSFEDEQAFVRSGWENRTSTEAPVGSIPRIALDPIGVVGHMGLVLDIPYAGQNEQRRAVLPEPARIDSPVMQVYENDIVVISGQIRIPQRLDAQAGGFNLFDTVYGESAALRWTEAIPKWTRFQLVRHIGADSELRLQLELLARGRVELDDIQVVVIPAEVTDTELRAESPADSPPNVEPAGAEVRVP
ncbi:MAG: hypothetical protein KDA66_02925 [Planctomycetaceae bacterium]|nr:hypothetical protein [Planctomycetaceae bacterium]